MGTLVIFMFIVVTVGNIFSSWWLSYWFRQGDGVSTSGGCCTSVHVGDSSWAHSLYSCLLLSLLGIYSAVGGSVTGSDKVTG